MSKIKENELAMKNIESADVSNLVELALVNINYSKERIIHYTFLIEEALLKWQENLPKNSQLQYRIKRTKRRIVFTFTIKGEKCNPFEINSDNEGDSTPLDKMIDKLLSGVGTELKYSYKKGVNRIILNLPIAKDYESAIYKKNLILLMVPIAIQQLFLAIVSNTDSIMLGFIQAEQMSAVSLVTKFANIPSFVGVSIALTGVAVLSQFWGKRDRNSVYQGAGIIMKFALLVGGFFCLISLLIPKQILSLYTQDETLIEYGAKYLRIIAVPILLDIIERTLFCFMQVVGEVKKSMAYSLIACSFNVVFNGIFIFGLFGIPQLGVVGAGLATVISYTIQGAIVVIHTIKHKEIKINFITKNKKLYRPILKVMLPTLVQYCIWMIGNNFVISAYGHKGTDMLSANSVLIFLYSSITAIASGFRSGTAIWIGRYLGRNQLDIAKTRAKQSLRITFITACFCAVIFVLLGLLVRVLPLDLNEEALRIFNIMLPIGAINLIFCNLNSVIVGGFLQAGGDTTSVLIIDVSLSVYLTIMSLLSIYGIIQLSVVALLLVIGLDELFSFPFKFARYKQCHWIKSFTKK